MAIFFVYRQWIRCSLLKLSSEKAYLSIAIIFTSRLKMQDNSCAFDHSRAPLLFAEGL
jgi:hypothetical protein